MHANVHAHARSDTGTEVNTRARALARTPTNTKHMRLKTNQKTTKLLKTSLILFLVDSDESYMNLNWIFKNIEINVYHENSEFGESKDLKFP
jgi:hypothetical protein